MALTFPLTGGSGGSVPNPFTEAFVITPSVANVTPLTLNQSLTGSGANAALTINPTLNTSGTVNVVDISVTDTASNAASNLIRARVGGVDQFLVRKDGRVAIGPGSATTGLIIRPATASTSAFLRGDAGDYASLAANLLSNTAGLRIGSLGSIDWTNSGANPLDGGTVDLRLFRDGAGILSQRNGTNAQTFRVAATDDGAGNFIRLVLAPSATRVNIFPENGGTGGAVPLGIGTPGATSLFLFTNNGDKWLINSSGHFLAFTDNFHDIGSPTNRPRNLFMASWIRFAVTVVGSLPAAGTAGQGARMLVTDANATTFQSIVAGGGTNVVPVYSDGTNWRIG